MENQEMARPPKNPKSPRKQQTLDAPGMAPASIPIIEEKAELVRNLTTQRMSLQNQEETARLDLIGEIHKQIQEGNLKVPPGSDTDIVSIYNFNDTETGEKLVVKWGRHEGVKVNKAKPPRAAATELNA